MRIQLNKTQCKEILFEFGVPSTMILFEAINCVLKTTYMGRISRVLKSRWVSHVNFFSKTNLQEGIVNIQLMDMTIKLSGDSYDETDNSRLDYWT